MQYSATCLYTNALLILISTESYGKSTNRQLRGKSIAFELKGAFSL